MNQNVHFLNQGQTFYFLEVNLLVMSGCNTAIAISATLSALLTQSVALIESNSPEYIYEPSFNLLFIFHHSDSTGTLGGQCGNLSL